VTALERPSPLLATLEIELLGGFGLVDRAVALLDASFDQLVRVTPPARSRLLNARALIALIGVDIEWRPATAQMPPSLRPDAPKER